MAKKRKPAQPAPITDPVLSYIDTLETHVIKLSDAVEQNLLTLKAINQHAGKMISKA